MNREIIQDGTGNYLKLWDVEGDSFGDNIFSHNQPKGFLPVELQWINGRKEYLYDISGRISLGNYLSKNSFSLEEVCVLFQKLFAMSDEMGAYLLDQNGVIVQEDYLYVGKEIGSVAGIYQPEAGKGLVEAFARLLEFIMEKMNQKNQELVFFVYNMHKLAKQPECTKELLRQYVESAMVFPREKEEETVEKTKRESQTDRRGRTGRKNQTDRRGQTERRHRTDREKPRQILPGKEYFSAVLLVFSAVFGYLFLWFYGVFQTPLTGRTDWLKAGGAALFFLSVTGYGVWRLLGSGKKRERDVYWELDEVDKKVCLIPQRGGEPVPIMYFPCHVGTAEGKVDTVIQAEGISGVHAQFLREGGDILVMDEESVGGTFANEQRLAPWQKKKIEDGDILRLATKEFVVEITQSEYVI